MGSIKKHKQIKGLTKYNIYLRPQGIETLTNNIKNYLDESFKEYFLPSLGYHITILGFYSETLTEKNLLEKFSKLNSNDSLINNISTNVYLDSVTSFESHLVINTVPNNLKIIHNYMLDEFIPSIVLKGNIRAVDNINLFHKRYPFIGHHYNPHMTIARGNFSNENLENIETILSVHNREYPSKLYLAKKENNIWKNISEM